MHEYELKQKYSDAARAAAKEFLPTVMRKPTETDLSVARIILLNLFTRDITDDNAIELLYSRRCVSTVRSRAMRVRKYIRPVFRDFYECGLRHMEAVA